MKQIHSAGRTLSRRNLLLSAGGATLGLPFLRSVTARADEVKPPKRLVLVYSANGTVPSAWQPAALRSSQDFDLGSILEPLAPFRERLVGMTGVHSQVAMDAQNRGGPHQRGIGSLFTGAMLQEGEFADGCGSLAGWSDGPSIDQLLAQGALGDAPLRSLELGVRCLDNDVQGRISYAGPGAPLPPLVDPRLTFGRLFNRDLGGSASRESRVMDAVMDQWKLLRKNVGKEDAAKLDAHAALVVDLEQRLGEAVPPAGQCAVPNTPAALNPDSEIDMPAVSRAQLDLVALAFSCDLTRIVSLQYSTGFNRIAMPWLDQRGEGHALSHSGDSDSEAMAALAGRGRWHAGEIAYLAEKLSQIPEGDGSVLDSTLIVWGTEVSQGNSHALTDIPYLLLGTAQGKIRGGQWLTLAGRPSNDLLITIAHAFDLELPSIGAPNITTGLLEELLA
jgi:hypothetical protein